MENTTRLAPTRSAAFAVVAPRLDAAAARPAPAAARAHVRRTGTVAVPAPVERAFPLFTPLGERLWAPGWEPRFHHPPDGEARAGATFSTRDEQGRETLWLIVDWQPERHRVRYARVTPGLRAGTVEVACAPGPNGATLATVTYDLVALAAEGDEDLASWTESWYASYLMEWEEQIAVALSGD